jgi:histidinol-phosphatase (PHP family)
MLVDYHVHGVGHRTSRHTLEELSSFVEAGLAANLAEIGFADHDFYIEDLAFSNFPLLQKRFPKIKIRVGLEVEYLSQPVPGVLDCLDKYSFDYLIGSVHFVEEWPFDHPEFKSGYKDWDADDLYRAYFNLVSQMACTKRYNIVGHLDLIKVFGCRSRASVVELAGQCLQVVQKSGMAVEINTSGRYKPVEEVYPALNLLEECFRLGIPITLSSDAHFAEDVGRDIYQARELAWKIGYREVATFEKRQRIMQPL